MQGGGNLVQTIKRSYSLSDLSEPDVQRTKDEIDEVMALRPQQRLLRARNQTALGRSSSGSRHSTGMYFTEVDVTAKGAGDFNYNIRSTDDISSGYSSAEPLSVGLSRTSSMTNASKARLKTKRNENVVAYEQLPRESVQSVPQQFQHFYLVDDLRDEVFLENELYFQNAHDSTLDDDLSAAESTDLLVQQPVEMAEKQVMAPKVERTSSEQQVTLPSPNTMSIEDQMTLPSQNTTSIEQQMKPTNVEPPKIAHESDDDDDDDDFFEATLLVDSNDLSDAAPKRLDVDVIDKAPPVLNIEVKLDNTAANNKTPSFRPRELLSTLEEIQNNFRAQIETNNEIERPRAQHNKGKAPPPPSSLTPPLLPPRATKPERDNLDSISLTSIMTRSERTPSPARTTGIGNLFKNIKANVLRSKANNNDGQDNRAQQQINQANVIQPGKIHVR